MLFLFCGIFADVLAPYGMNEISPVNRLKPPSLGLSGSAPTISAATCSRAACTARSCR
jgi:peptide/nickel transport system permease protein